MQPHRIKIGAGVILVSLDGLAVDWGITVDGVEHMLNALELPRIKFPGGEKRYVGLYGLEDALFELGLPDTFKGNRALVRAHHELAGVLYGTLSREVIRERCLMLAKTLKGNLTSRRKKTTIRKTKRG